MTAPVGDVPSFDTVGVSESFKLNVIAVIARIRAIETRIITLLLFSMGVVIFSSL